MNRMTIRFLLCALALLSTELRASEYWDGNVAGDIVLQTPAGDILTSYSIQDEYAIIEGDIIVAKMEELATLAAGPKGVVITFENKRWPDRTVYYKIDADSYRPAEIQMAINHWISKTNLDFQPATATTSNYVRFKRGKGCSSWVGMQGGMQAINLAAGCGYGSIVHEIGHAIGLWHEQSREDRDNYVTIKTDNIQSGKEHNFRKHITDGTDVGPYDFGSIMHYSEKAFSRNGLPTIVPRRAVNIGQRNALSTIDKFTVNKIYSIPQPTRQCLTLAALSNAPEAGKFDFNVAINGTLAVADEINYGAGGHKVYYFKAWVDPGEHLVVVSSQKLGRSLSKKFDFGTGTDAVYFQYFGHQRRGRSNFWIAHHIPDYDDSSDPVDCDNTTVVIPPQSSLKDEDPASEMSLLKKPVRSGEKLTSPELIVPPGKRFVVPEGVTELNVDRLVMGDGSSIKWLDGIPVFYLTAKHAEIGDRVRFLSDGAQGSTGADGSYCRGSRRNGGSGQNGGPGGKGMTLWLDLGSAHIGERLRITLEGGEGGRGGKGGKGCNGEVPSCVDPFGATRHGGRGGPGGYSGIGGQGGSLVFTADLRNPPLQNFKARVLGGESDNGGQGGDGGNPHPGRNCGLWSRGAANRGDYGTFRHTDAEGRERYPVNGDVIMDIN